MFSVGLINTKFFLFTRISGGCVTVFSVVLPFYSFNQVFTVNDPIKARGIYLILGVQEGAFNRWEAFKRERHFFS